VASRLITNWSNISPLMKLYFAFTALLYRSGYAEREKYVWNRVHHFQPQVKFQMGPLSVLFLEPTASPTTRSRWSGWVIPVRHVDNNCIGVLYCGIISPTLSTAWFSTRHQLSPPRLGNRHKSHLAELANNLIHWELWLPVFSEYLTLPISIICWIICLFSLPSQTSGRVST